MQRAYFKKWYLVVSLILSLYLVAVTIIGFTSVPESILKPLDEVAYYVLWFFIAELVVLFFVAKDARRFFKEQWLSIVAVVSSISITQLADALVGIGTLTGLKALKGFKSVKGVKSLKFFKAAKGAKVAKSVKIGKKASKAAKRVDELEKNKP